MWSRISIIVRTCFVLTLLLGMTLLAIPKLRVGLQRWITSYTSHVVNDREIVWRRETGKSRGSDAANAPRHVESPKPRQRLSPKLTPVSLTPVRQARTDTKDATGVLRLRQQLVALGATNLRLETPTTSNLRCRFACELPVDDHSVYRRRFSAEADRELAAIQRVFNDISRWRAACRVASHGQHHPTER